MNKLIFCFVTALAPVYFFLTSQSAPQSTQAEEQQYDSADARFMRLIQSPHIWAHAAMNSQREILMLNRKKDVRQGKEPSTIQYDKSMNAALVQMSGSGIAASKQLRVFWPVLNHTNAQTVSIQWEARWDRGFAITPGMSNLKAFQISDPDEDLMFELQTRMHPDAGVVAMPTVRYYRANQYSEATDSDPMSSLGPYISKINNKLIDNWQPGGDTAIDYRMRPRKAEHHLNSDYWSPYLILPELWYRITFEFQYEHNELRFCAWFQSETETDATLVIASVETPGKCFMLSSDVKEHDLSFQNWWLEMNSSQEVAFDHEIRVWIKNLVVYKDASVPLM